MDIFIWEFDNGHFKIVPSKDKYLLTIHMDGKWEKLGTYSTPQMAANEVRCLDLDDLPSYFWDAHITHLPEDLSVWDRSPHL